MAEKEVKTNFFEKIIDFVSSPFGSKEEKHDDDILSKDSKYNHYLENIDSKSETYLHVEEAVRLCTEASKIYKHKKRIENNITALDKRMDEIECFHRLTNIDIKKLKDLISRYLSVVKEKNEIKSQLESFDSNLILLEQKEGDARFSLEQIQDSEKKQRILRHDIGYIEGERAELEYEKEKLLKSFEFIKKTSLFIVSLFSIITCALAYLYIFTEKDIINYSIIMVIAMIICITIIFVFRRKTSFEIQLNSKKQNMAVSLLNKKNTVISYYNNFLRYEYKKYKVHNSQTLSKHLKELEHFIHINKRYDSLRKISYKTEEEIELFLKHKNVKKSLSSLEQFITTLNIEDKKSYYEELYREKESNLDELENINSKHDEIWDFIVLLNSSDPTPDNIIGSMIQEYFITEGNDGVDKKAVIV